MEIEADNEEDAMSEIRTQQLVKCSCLNDSN